MKKMLVVLIMTLCIGQLFATESSLQPLPTKVKPFITKAQALTVINDVSWWEPGYLPPENPPVQFYAGGYIITVYSVFNEGQLYAAFDFVTYYNNDWYAINTYLCDQFDCNYDITIPRN